MDVRDCFVVYNQWGQHVPCPDCCPTGFRKPPPRNRVGVCNLIGQDRKTGMYIYVCPTCQKERN